MASLRDEYLLDPEVTYLNHGSFGACPKEVFAVYQRWQRELERNPVVFLSEVGEPLRAAREKLAAYLGAPGNDLIFATNPTHAFNQAVRSLELKPGDEILATSYEYPAMEQGWAYIAHKTGASYIHQPAPLPLTSHEEFIEQYWAGVNEHTKVIFLSHILAGGAIILPVEEICRRARAAGILTIVDGAHAPSQIPLDLEKVGADIYFGACHKWLSAPKGSGFLYARPEAQAWLEPLVVSTGWLQEKPLASRSEPDGLSWFAALNAWQGTRDPAAFLAVPAAIDFQASHAWDGQRQRCHELLAETRRRIHALTGLAPLCPDSSVYYSQMSSVLLPAIDPGVLSKRLWEEFKIVIPVGRLNGCTSLRVSIQAYNEERDADALLAALTVILK